MPIREDFKLLLLFVTALATSVAAYATYQIYLEQTVSSTLSLQAYKINGTQEVSVDDPSSMTFKKLNSNEGVDDYELPLQLSNDGDRDVEGIHLLLDIEGGELVVPNDWIIGSYADNPRYHKLITHLTPKTVQKLSEVKVRIKNTTHEVKLRWSILAKRTIPPEGTMVLRF